MSLEAQILYEFWKAGGATPMHGQNLLDDCERGQPLTVNGTVFGIDYKTGKRCG